MLIIALSELGSYLCKKNVISLFAQNAWKVIIPKHLNEHLTEIYLLYHNKILTRSYTFCLLFIMLGLKYFFYFQLLYLCNILFNLQVKKEVSINIVFILLF